MTMRSSVRSVRPTRAEEVADRPGDDIVPAPDVVMDRGFTLPAPPEEVWPWLVQLGKRRAGWYLPAALERVVPRRRRALRAVDQRWRDLAAGDVVPDYGGRHATFEVARIDPPHTLVYRSRRGSTTLSWAILLSRTTSGEQTRVHLRLRLGPVRRPWLATSVGEWFDLLTIAAMATGLRERLDRSSGR